MSRLASLRRWNCTPSFSANATLAQTLSTLIPRITVLFELNSPVLSWYFAISLVQPGENAAGKNASTTFFCPLNWLSLTDFRSRRPFASAALR
jgi:hypothetical protein